MNRQHTIRNRFLALCLALSSTNGFSVDIEDAVHAMRDGNFAEAYCMLRPLATSGDPEAQYNIGWMYLNGYGLAINDSLALEWWQQASNQGYTDATFSLAMLYSVGDGQVDKDLDRALDYYLIAIDDGHEDATLIVKSMLLRDDKSIHQRAPEIIKKYSALLGGKRQIKSKRANIRSGAGKEHKIIKVLDQGDVVIEMVKHKQWSQIIIPGDDVILWVFSSLLEPYEVPDS